MSPRDVDAAFVQAIRDCTQALQTITELIVTCSHQLDEATRRIESLPWQTEPLQVKLADAAKMLSLNKTTVRRLVANGQLKATGKHTGLRVSVESIRDYIARESHASLLSSPVFDKPFGVSIGSHRPRRRHAPLDKSDPTTTHEFHFKTWDGPFKCSECGLGFDSQRSLWGHKSGCKGKNEWRKPGR